MTKLHRLFDEYGQSPWLDNLTRSSLRDGTLRDLVRQGVRGVTANPTIFARAITRSHDYDELEVAGIELEDVARTLEAQGIASFRDSFDEAPGALDAQAHRIATG